jgi:hypothetical protein
MMGALRSALAAMAVCLSPAAAQEAADWTDGAGRISLSFEAQGWAVVPSTLPEDRFWPLPPLLMIAPGGTYSQNAATLQPHCELTAPMLESWEEGYEAAPSQAAANEHFKQVARPERAGGRKGGGFSCETGWRSTPWTLRRAERTW